MSADAQTVAFMASDAATVPEVYVAPTKTMAPRKLTTTGEQVATWPSAPIEVVSWPSRDGATIEGILHKPVGFQPGKRYPLLVVIHGGPTGVSRATPFSSTSIYPIDLWVAKGALVLEPNYRGSAGYGEKFRSLNYRNLGVGDAWDVLSGVDYLVKEGLADASRVGAMGWSQGGYISAFLSTHDSARFKAISVGAGISNWMTYYVNTDIHPFTRQYLNATPWDDPEIYAKTSPMTYIKGAKAPTLIQHGATDQRVPLPNAYELYQGLQDVGVPTKLIVYKGFEGIGHGPSKPKSSRALMEHNLEWFEKYLFAELTYFFETFTPPLCVRTRIGAPPPPRFALSWRSMRPCTVTGKSMLNPPLTVPVSRCAEYCSGMRRCTPPLLVSTSSPSPFQPGPSRSTSTPPLLVRPFTSPAMFVSLTPPLTVLNSTVPSTSRMLMPPLVVLSDSIETVGTASR